MSSTCCYGTLHGRVRLALGRVPGLWKMYKEPKPNESKCNGTKAGDCPCMNYGSAEGRGGPRADEEAATSEPPLLRLATVVSESRPRRLAHVGPPEPRSAGSVTETMLACMLHLHACLHAASACLLACCICMLACMLRACLHAACLLACLLACCMLGCLLHAWLLAACLLACLRDR
ncbi:hypothetical protein SFRURICE_005347 [Spodoptera frugiperda]|nr:hypothetical protein SFRURICE_005347 [Spodoptera frugiperda]